MTNRELTRELNKFPQGAEVRKFGEGTPECVRYFVKEHNKPGVIYIGPGSDVEKLEKAMEADGFENRSEFDPADAWNEWIKERVYA